MPEGLSPEDNSKAEGFYSRHLEAVDANEGAAAREEETGATLDAMSLDEMGTREGIVAANNEFAAREGLQQAYDAHDANLLRADQHKEEHLGEYIETAKQEAEAAGHEIDLGADEAPE
jgi:hypothetical protein